MYHNITHRGVTYAKKMWFRSEEGQTSVPDEKGGRANGGVTAKTTMRIVR